MTAKPSDSGNEPRKLRTQYYTEVRDALEAVVAATALGFGVVLRNQLELGRILANGESCVEGWLVDVLEHIPEVDDAGEPE